MAFLRSLGMKELKELGCRFVVANVPVFASLSDSKKTHKMTTNYFSSLDEVKLFMRDNVPLIVFDLTSVYKNRSILRMEGDKDKYCVRCCKVNPNELKAIQDNCKESGSVNYTFKFDFSCWN
jgi:hypothetical protein